MRLVRGIAVSLPVIVSAWTLAGGPLSSGVVLLGSVHAAESARAPLPRTALGFFSAELGYSIRYPRSWVGRRTSESVTVFEGRPGTDAHAAAVRVQNVRVRGSRDLSEVLDAVVKRTKAEIEREAPDVRYLEEKSYAYSLGPLRLEGRQYVAAFTTLQASTGRRVPMRRWYVLIPRPEGAIAHVWSYGAPEARFETYRPLAEAMLRSWTLSDHDLRFERPPTVVGDPSVEDLVRFFDEIVFRSEMRRGARPKTVMKLTGPLRVAASGRVSDRDKAYITNHLAYISKVTGLASGFVEASNDSLNMHIVFVPRAMMGKLNILNADPELVREAAAAGGCYFIFFPDREAAKITYIVIVVNSDRDAAGINHCLLEEMIQSLGLSNDSDMLRPSIFSDYDRLYELSRWDEVLVRTLYDARMTPGLPRKEALKLAPTIIRELVERGP